MVKTKKFTKLNLNKPKKTKAFMAATTDAVFNPPGARYRLSLTLKRLPALIETEEDSATELCMISLDEWLKSSVFHNTQPSEEVLLEWYYDKGHEFISSRDPYPRFSQILNSLRQQKEEYQTTLSIPSREFFENYCTSSIHAKMLKKIR